MRGKASHIFSTKDTGIFEILMFEILTTRQLTTSLVLNNWAQQNWFFCDCSIFSPSLMNSWLNILKSALTLKAPN